MTFDALNLIQPLLEAITLSGYKEPTPIQEATIPLVLEGRDVLGCAQTGTGKTAAYALPILQRLSGKAAARGQERRPIRALIMAPTRELAIQISESFDTYGAGLSLTNCVICGGVRQKQQVEMLKAGVDILVATPGRLNDLINQRFIRLNKLETLVLDEADRMLDMGFINDIRRILRCIPASRQTLFFSATMPPDVERLAMTILHDPSTVMVDSVNSTVDSIAQSLYYVDKINKSKLLASLLKESDVHSALVFTRTKFGADKVAADLIKDNIRAIAIHGDKTQNARQEALRRFTSGEAPVLVATDIAARGLDISELSHVINYDIPEDSETYIHRIGRTGRAGLSGSAISFCSYDEFEHLFAIEKLIDKKIPVVDSPWPMEVCSYTPEARKPRPSGGQNHRPRRDNRPRR